MKNIGQTKKAGILKNTANLLCTSINDRYNPKLELPASDFLTKISEQFPSLAISEHGKAYSILKQFGAQPGDFIDAGSFQIEEHFKLGLSPAQSADRIAQNFAQISQEYPALRIENLTTMVIKKLANAALKGKPIMSQN